MRRPAWHPLWPLMAMAPLVAIAAAAIIYGTRVERLNIRTRHVDIDLPELPSAFDRYRIVQLSDFHMGGRGWSHEVMKRAVDLALEEHADMIVLTGDFLETAAALPQMAELLGKLQAPDGVVAIFGNHDYSDHGVRIPAILATFKELGIRVLRNEAMCIRRGADGLWIVGVDDPYTGHDYLPRALTSVPAAVHPLMLVHYPDFAWRLPPDRYLLVLSGHTHGSQVRLPLIGRYARERIAHTRFSSGIYRINRTPVFVTSGVGTSGRPIRINAFPEVASILLHATASAAADSGTIQFRQQ